MQAQNTIAVAMSGGVDSSTVAAMLAEKGEGGTANAVVGLTLQSSANETRLAGKHGIPDAPKAGRAVRWTMCTMRGEWRSTWGFPTT